MMIDKTLIPRRDIAFGLYDQKTDSPQVAVDLLYCRGFALFEDDAARVLARLLRGESTADVLRDLRAQSPENAEEYVQQTLEFLGQVGPSLFQNIDAQESPSNRALDFSDTQKYDDLFLLQSVDQERFLGATCELTYRCQLRCRHCYNSDHEKKDELSTGAWIDAISQMRAANAFRLGFTGGDPFARSDLWEILEHTRSLHMAFDLLTNAQALCHWPTLDRLTRLNPRSVQVSLYGAESAVHDAVTGVPGSFDKTIQALRQLSERNIPLAIKSPAMTLNYRSLPKIAEIAHELNAVHQVDLNITPQYDGTKTPLSLRLDDQQMAEVMRYEGLPLYHGMEKMAEYGAAPRNPDDPLCGGGRSSLTILRNGTVVPCLTFPLRLGSLTESTLEEILAAEPLQQWRSLRLDSRKGKCAECGMTPFCSFCPGDSYLEKGDPLSDNASGCQIAAVRKNFCETFQNR